MERYRLCPRGRRAPARHRPKRGGRLSAARRAIGTVALAALAIRLALLWVRGEYLVYDEGYYLLLARSLRAGHGFTLNGLPHVALSPLQPVLVAVLSLTGLPDLWGSRLLAAVCGAALVMPVAALGARWYGARGALTAAVFVAVFPALLTFLPFFPGRHWNLYFGSEPLYLLLAVSAIAAGARAATDEHWRWWLATGGLGALAYLTRLEGVVLSAALGCALLAALIVRGRLALWPRAGAALAVGVLIAAPYLWYLHGALGRWALSGRVQAAISEAAPPAAAPSPASGGGGSSHAVRDFVWGGDMEGLWRTLYALNGAGTRMASQYWGVPTAAEPPAPAVARPDLRVLPPPDSARPGTRPASTGAATTLVRAIGVVVPVWFLALALVGLWNLKPARDAALWLAPMAIASLLPALLAYAEPRALLLLVPAACLLAAGACERLRAAIEARALNARLAAAVPVAVAMALAVPSGRDLAGAWSQQTPLQRVAAARRVVGEYLGAHLPPDGRVVSWHPAIALWAEREWRVLPYEPFDRIVGYALAQRARTIVFSRFDPSPLREPPRAFTAVLLDSASRPAGDQLRLDSVDATPSLFVGRLAPPHEGRPPR